MRSQIHNVETKDGEPDYNDMTDLSFNEKLSRLEKIYAWYDTISGSMRPWICGAGCSTCCTSMVIMTSLEAEHMWAKNSALLKARVQAWSADGEWPLLTMTTNQRALACISKEDFEEEAEIPEGTNACPLLENARCICYEARPLMCHLMLSSVPCEKTGHAEMPSELLSLTTVCIQLVEDLDKDGWSGYLTHILPLFLRQEFGEGSWRGSILGKDSRLLRNLPNPGLVVPPEHQVNVHRWLRELYLSF